MAREITFDECKEILKRLMIREYDRIRAEHFQEQAKEFKNHLMKNFQKLLQKLIDLRPPPKTEPSLDVETLVGAARPKP